MTPSGRPAGGVVDPATLFADRFGRPATLRVRAPGRVNLIGEHVDYVGLPVLPVALDRAVVLHAAPRRDTVVRVANADPRFGERRFTLGPDPEPGAEGDWINYLLAAARDRVRAWAGRAPPLRGFDALLTSDVPVAAGLSSSAALVVATARALEAANDLATPPLELAAALARAERFVGTEGGGMDQAASLCARRGHAALIGFGPLSVEHVPVPAGWTFIVADSGVVAEKSGAARDAYNARARACHAALEAIRTGLGVGPDAGYPELLARHTPAELLDAARALPDDRLRRRFRHVVTEAGRVAAARAALEADGRADFGRLMNASHASLRDDYEVSTPELDRIAELARAAGADGARLTGAGFGGCVVAVCPTGRERAVMDALEDGYFRRLPDPGPPEDRLFVARPSEDRLFVLRPSDGAGVDALPD